MIKALSILGVACVAFALTARGSAQDGAKKGYILVQVDISNPTQYGEYTKVTPGLIEKFGGHFIARGGRTATLEGPDARGRVVVIEFPTFERAQQFYNSPEYVAARKIRAGAATAQMILVEGV